MKYLITGGCGFIGSHLAEELVRQGEEVVIYDNLSSGYEKNIEPIRERLTFIKADIRDLEALYEAMNGVNYVFHEAALVSVFDSVERPLDNNAINIAGTLNVLLAGRRAKVNRVVMASSAAVYGNEPTLPKREDMHLQPESPYALAKITDEYYMRVFARLYGLETVSLRYFNVYGPRQDPGSMYSGVISKFVDVLASGRQPTVFGDGLQSRDFVYVKDVVQANILAMHSSRAGKGESFNVATGRRLNLLELLEVLGKIFKRKVKPNFAEARPGDITHSVADISAAREVLEYEPGFTVEAGLKALVESVF